MSNIFIDKATPDDLPTILALQYLAYKTEAERLNNYNIQPLQQTLAELEREYNKGIILKALASNKKLVASVRGYIEKDILFVGKLFVHPDYREQGIGESLLYAIEKASPTKFCQLFTSAQSINNLSLYHKVGYRPFQETISNGIKFVYLQKHCEP